MSLDKVLQTVIRSVPESVAAGYIDLESGMLLGMQTVEAQPTNVIDLLAAATSDIFQGPNVRMIENMFKKMRGIEGKSHHYFQEIIINSENLLHIFCRSKRQTSHVLCVVCRISTNLGMALTKTRQAIIGCEKAI
jgi:hypothetical protein